MSLISAIIMASGFSRRMGENKLLMKYNNKFLIEYTLDVISKCNFKDKLIVTQYEKIKEIGENLDFKVVKNKYPNRGISESIKLGIKNCEESEGYMFFVGDQPLLDKKDIEKLIDVFNEDTSFIVIPKYKNRFGNPVIYPKKYKEDILNLEGDKGGKSIIKSSDKIKYVDVCENTLFDIDNIGEKLVAQNIMPPFVVKPNCEGSSLGITDDNLCDNFKKVENVAKNLLKDFSEVIIEKYVPGYECTVWVIGNPDKFHLVAPLLISQNENFYFKRKIFTIQDKANKVRRYALPNGILSNEIIKQIKQISKSIFIELGLRDYARFDFRITDNKIFFIEANALPIFSKTSEIGQITKLYNISYENICSLLIQTINERLMTKTN